MATLSLHSLFELRSNLTRGTVMLDVEASNLAHIAGEWERCGHLRSAYVPLEGDCI